MTLKKLNTYSYEGHSAKHKFVLQIQNSYTRTTQNIAIYKLVCLIDN